MKISLSLLGIVLIFCSACQSDKVAYMEDYSHFVEDIRQDHDEFSEEEWERNDEKMEYFLEELSELEEELSTDEKLEIASETMTYYLYRFKDGAEEELDRIGEQDLEDLRLDLNRLMDAGLDAIEGILPEIERLGPELEDLGYQLERDFKQKVEERQLERKIEETMRRLERNQQERERY